MSTEPTTANPAPALLTEPLTLTLDGEALAALNDFRQHAPAGGLASPDASERQQVRLAAARHLLDHLDQMADQAAAAAAAEARVNRLEPPAPPPELSPELPPLNPRARVRGGLTRPPEDATDCPVLSELLVIGKDWVAAAERLPHEDRDGRLYYMVYSPATGNLLQLAHCVGGQWSSQRTARAISGITHWRIARNDEVERQASAAELPAAASQ